jgi:hypothetical protein
VRSKWFALRAFHFSDPAIFGRVPCQATPLASYRACDKGRQWTSIVFCAANNDRPLLVGAATFFPIGVVHGVGVWFGGW